MQLDLTRPHTGRVLDYWLGGSHNFEVDRQLAHQVAKSFPVAVQVTKDSRAMVRRCVEYFHAHGIRAILDFGASLPTTENTHIVANAIDPQMLVVYSDIDPIIYAYGQELLQGNPNAIYLQADAATPHVVLDSPLTRQLIGDERRVGFVFLNLALFLEDDALRQSWRALYDWAAPGSYLAVSSSNKNWLSDPELTPARDNYRNANIIVRFRTVEETLALASPWQLTEEGIAVNASWGLTLSHAPAHDIGYSMMFRK
ncbi:MAG: SAM-dependent methyltransferase [Chloroflexi bacterium]|nr:SAM-dependent methyltransferase [Chloroflexota bacterium]